jgi:hypothetical protein
MYYWEFDAETKILQKYNAAFVFDRKGTNLGSYYKIFPVFEMAYGIGNEVLYPSRKGLSALKVCSHSFRIASLGY